MIPESIMLRCIANCLETSRYYGRNAIARSPTGGMIARCLATAATTVIVEPAEIVPTGVIPPDDVITPHVLVDHIIEMDR
jgi:acyl CoA:acetate/3-ketoacid CoA transferase alpha subunit